MATGTRPEADQRAASSAWRSVSAEEAVARFGVDPSVGRSTPCRGVSRSILTREAFDNSQMNWTALAELALAVLITQAELFNRLLKTTPLSGPQFGLALASAVLLLVLWEVGKLIARRQSVSGGSPAPGAPTQAPVGF